MNRNYIKIICVIIVITITIILFIVNNNKVCNNDFLKIAKNEKNLENIELCIKENHVDAAILLSEMYAKGDNLNKNFAKAIEVLDKFVKSGHTLAMIESANLLSCYSYEAKHQDLGKAEYLYKKAIGNQDNYREEAIFELARFYVRKYYKTKEDQYRDLYITLLTELANAGNTKSMLALAGVYKDGIHVKQDYNISLEWLQRAAQKGDAIAYRSIGNYYANGYLEDPANYEKAKYFFHKSAELGDDVSVDFLQENPSPFGLEITQATISDFFKKFKKYKKIEHPNDVNGGYTYTISSKDIPIDGIKEDVVFVFNTKSILESVFLTFEEYKCYDMQSHLQKKYRPFINDSRIFFRQGLTQIYIDKKYVFYPPINVDPFREHKLGGEKFCSLVYKSRFFSSQLHNLQESIIKKIQNNEKRKPDIF